EPGSRPGLSDLPLGDGHEHTTQPHRDGRQPPGRPRRCLIPHARLRTRAAVGTRPCAERGRLLRRVHRRHPPLGDRLVLSGHVPDHPRRRRARRRPAHPLARTPLRAIVRAPPANGMPSTVTHMVYSHSHADHIGASSLFGPDVIRIGHAENLGLLLRDDDPNRPPPTVTFEDRYVLEVGGERLELAYHGPNSAPDNIFIHAPAHQTLMVVDVIFPGWVPFKSLALAQDIPGWIGAQQVAMSYPWTTLVAGHLGRLGTRADGHTQIQYMADLQASTRAAIASVDPTPYFQQYSPNAWAIFKAYLDEVSTRAADPITAKYTGVLAAADVYSRLNAAAMLDSLRVDTGDLGPFSGHP